ncbi:hypothetical protein [Mesorhizobium sp. WSM3626]|uniref:hypothetical protein n=1 Tax=Mesorhizobium sp. WSM3626 TaxID=1040987 RepID=UPI0012ECA72D|nr:hypothetical protein [Mesorhizobium sp. WSM3626]
MPVAAHRSAIRSDLGAIFVSWTCHARKWLITWLSPGGGASARHIASVLARFAELSGRGADRNRMGLTVSRSRLGGFWEHGVLTERIESHVVDPPPPVGERAKTDWIYGEARLRVLLTYKPGKPLECAIVHAPTPVEAGDGRAHGSATC